MATEYAPYELVQTAPLAPRPPATLTVTPAGLADLGIALGVLWQAVGSGFTGAAVTSYLAAQNLVTDRVAFAAHYNAHRAEIDRYFQYVHAGRVAALPGVQKSVRDYAGAIVAGALVGAGAVYLLKK